METSAPQKAFERFGLRYEPFGAEFGQLAQVVQFPADTGQFGKMRNPQ
jgi:hypothetical protein